MIHASLFSGIGGPEVAAAMLGWENAFHCEINPFGRKILEYWFPLSKSYENIITTDFSEWRGKIDILTGGFPCQPFSYAGKRGGGEDERYLWPQMLRAIDEIRPTWVVGENVAGLTTMVEGGVLTEMGCDTSLFGEDDGVHRYGLRQSFTIERICRDLENLGYSVQPMLIPAAAVGAPHRRDRIFIIAYTENLQRNGSRIGHEGKLGGQPLPEFGNGGWEDDAAHTADLGLQRAAQQGAEGEICGEMGGKRHHTQRVVSTPTNGIRRIIANTDCGRSGEIPAPVHPRLPDGAEPLGNGSKRDVTDTESQQSDRPRLEQPEFSGEEQTQFGGEYCPDSNTRDAADSNSGGYSRSEERPGQGAGNDALWSCGELLPENRWASFPAISPVHRGDDGLPFSMDDLTIPATRWRTESLKAYGNAIVPQVMYRIFQAIEEVMKS